MPAEVVMSLSAQPIIMFCL